MKHPRRDPANFWFQLLELFCPPNLYEGIHGDLLERFSEDVESVGATRAKRKLAINVIKFCRPGIVLRNKFSFDLNQVYMVRNYAKVMLRSMMKRKTYSCINIFGLTAGLTFSMLTGVFVWQELNVNHQLKDVDRLYILESKQAETSGMNFFAPVQLTKTMAEEYPSIAENYYRFWDRNVKVSKGDKRLIIQSIVGDSTLLRMFGFPVLYGDVNTALDQPYSVVITENIAMQFFNRRDVVGETLLVSSGTSDKKEFLITAVLPVLKRNSVSDLVNINAQVFLSLQNWSDFRLPNPEGWAQGIVSYVKLSPNASSHDADNVINKIINTHAPDSMKSRINVKLAGLDDYYLITSNGTAKKLIMVMAGIAGFILLLAVINFINISISNASVRLKEIGVRKVIGGVRQQIILQFLSESFVLTWIAGALSLLCYEALRPIFESVLATTLSPIWQLDLSFWKWFILMLLGISLFSGAYPAFFMSSYKIIESLKGKIRSEKNGIVLPRILVTLQFLVAIFIFICAVVITEQVSYFLKKDLGYNKSFVLTVSSIPRIWSEEGVNKMLAAKREFLTSSNVEAVSLSWEIPNGNNGGDTNLYKDGTNEENSVLMPLLNADEDFYKVYQLKVLEGKFLHASEELWQPNSLVVNEAAQKALGLKVGDKVRMRGATIVYTIMGIVNDFHFRSLREPVKPLALLHPREFNMYRFLSFRLKPGNLSNSIKAVEEVWKKVFPDDPFDYAFMDEKLTSLYKSELQLKKASSIATGLMLIIVLTGVLGVVSLNVAKRTKEIGIRKVLGATVTDILAMISKDYLKLTMVAFLLSVPVAYYFADRWLNGFAYHIEISWWMFVTPGVFIFFITALIVTGQSLKTALLNPTNTLKYE